MMDIVIPHNNEEQFIIMAERLGYTALCFLYGPDDYTNTLRKSKYAGEKIKICFGIIADSKTIGQIKGKLKGESAFIAVKSSDNDRQIIEGAMADMIFSFEDSPRRDFIHHRASGLNHILCKLAKEKKVAVGLSLSLILNDKNKHIILGRMMQNIALCEKFKLKTMIASFAKYPYEMRSVHDIKSLFEILGGENMIFSKEIA